jgi:O-antigen/teichoic acid export membrane protein
MKELWRKVLASGGVRIYSFLVGLAALAVTARILGPDGRGVLAGVTAWATLLATLGSISIGQIVIHRAAGRRTGEWIETLFGALLLLAVSATVLVWSLALTIGYFKADIYGNLPAWALGLGFLAIPFLIWQNYGSNLLISSGNLDFYNRAQVLGASAGFVFMVIATVFLEKGVAGALVATLLAAAFISSIGTTKLWILAGEKITFRGPVIVELLKDGLKLHLNALGGVLLTAGNILMINYYSNADEVGWYQLASQVIAAMLILPQAAQRVLQEMTSKSGADRIWPDQKRILGRLMSLMFVLILAVYFLSPWLVVLVAGDKFLPSVDVLRPLLVSVFGVTMSYGMANQWLGRGLFLQTALLTLLSGIINVCLNALFVPRYGMIAAAWSLAFVYTVGLLTNFSMAIYVESKWRAASC